MSGMNLSTNATKKDEAIDLSTTEIVNSFENLINKIRDNIKDGVDDVTTGFNLSLTDIKKQVVNKNKYVKGKIIKGTDDDYLDALEFLYLIDYCSKSVDNLISNFTIVKKLGEKDAK